MKKAFTVDQTPKKAEPVNQSNTTQEELPIPQKEQPLKRRPTMNYHSNFKSLAPIYNAARAERIRLINLR